MSEKNKKNYNTKKWVWIGGIFLGLAILLFFGLIFFNNWLHHKLETMVRKESQGIYQLNLYSLQASPITGLLAVDSLSLEPDVNKWKEVNNSSEEAPRMLMRLRAGKIGINGLNYWNVLVGNNISLTSLSVLSPVISITRMRQDTTTQHKPMHELAKGMLKGISIGNITVQQANISYKHDPDQKADQITVTDLNIKVKTFQLDSQSFHAADKAYYADQIRLAADKAAFRTLDGFYKVASGPVKVDTDSGSVSISGVKIIPLLKASEMAEKNGKAITHFKGELGSFRVTGIQFAAHSRNNKILAGKAIISQPNLSLSKDKKNFPNIGKKPIPHEMVQQIQTDFHIDTIQVRDMYIRYEELAKGATEAGHLYFRNLNGTISNLSNMSDYVTDEKPAVLLANGRFMGKALLKATVVMPLLNENGYHTAEVEAGEADAQLLNPILEPTNEMSIKSGRILKGYAKMELNNKKGTGTMRVLYRNFKIELLSDSRGNEQSLGKKILSKAANKLAIKSDNPESPGEKPRIGDISVTRDPNRSIFTFWKDGLASGFLSSAGLNLIADK